MPEVKLENLPGLTSSTKPHSAGWTPWSAILIVRQSMMVYSVGFGFGFGFVGAIRSTKISGNFGPTLNGSVRSNRKSFQKTSPPFEVDHVSRSDRLEFWLKESRSWFSFLMFIIRFWFWFSWLPPQGFRPTENALIKAVQIELNLAFPVFISPIVWNMCENLRYESVYFK